MSLATDLTSNQQRLSEAERDASALLRRCKAVIPPEVYTGLQLHLIVIASETTKLKINLGAMRMTGELDQQPPPVTAERLELAQCVPMVPKHALRDESAAFALELRNIADDTLSEEVGS